MPLPRPSGSTHTTAGNFKVRASDGEIEVRRWIAPTGREHELGDALTFSLEEWDRLASAVQRLRESRGQDAPCICSDRDTRSGACPAHSAMAHSYWRRYGKPPREVIVR